MQSRAVSPSALARPSSTRRSVLKRTLRAHATRGDFREIYSRGDVPGAVLLIEADSAEAARALMDELPMAQRGMMEIQIVPLRPYRGFIGG